jgi:hypothetical protein
MCGADSSERSTPAGCQQAGRCASKPASRGLSSPPPPTSRCAVLRATPLTYIHGSGAAHLRRHERTCARGARRELLATRCDDDDGDKGDTESRTRVRRQRSARLAAGKRGWSWVGVSFHSSVTSTRHATRRLAPPFASAYFTPHGLDRGGPVAVVELNGAPSWQGSSTAACVAASHCASVALDRRQGRATPARTPLQLGGWHDLRLLAASKSAW